MILKKKIVLASTSAYRAALLHRLGLDFTVARPDADETALPGEAPADTAQRLALTKAQSLATTFPDALIIGADQVADQAGVAIGKPGTRDNARMQLLQMRSQTVIFHSGLALLNTGNGTYQRRVIATSVRYREYSMSEIENYLDREHALDCAGSAKAEGLGIALIASMQSDDPSALIGLPLVALIDMLALEGVSVLA